MERPPAPVVRLRKPRPDDLETLVRIDESDGSRVIHPDREGDRRAELARRLERDPDLQTEGIWFWMIEADGATVGDLQLRAPRHGFPPGVCGVGMTLLPTARGRGVGSAALEQACRLMADLGWARMQGETELDNHPMRRVFERCGFTFEGVLHGFLPGPDGTRADVAAYGLVLTPSR